MTDVLLRPDSDTATDGWTDQTGGTSNIYQGLDEVTAGDSDFVQSPQVAAAVVDLKVRLFDGATQIVEWTHSDISETFADVEQTLTAPQFAAITSFANLYAEFDDNQGNVYRFRIGDPPSGVDQPVKVRYRYKKLVAGAEDWTPADLGANLVAWYKADAGAYSDAGSTLAVNNDLVRQWNDQSGNNYHLLQATSGNRPTYKTADLNGLPTIYFDATTLWMRTVADSVTALSGAGSHSCFLVVRPNWTSGGSNDRFVGFIGVGQPRDYDNSTSSAFVLRDVSDSEIVSYKAGGPRGTAIAVTDLAPARLGSIYDASNLTLYKNNVGSTPTSYTATGLGTSGTILVNTDGFSGGLGGGGAKAHYAEIVITKHALSVDERAALDAYFVARYFASTSPDDAYVAADGVTTYVAADGSTFYVQGPLPDIPEIPSDIASLWGWWRADTTVFQNGAGTTPATADSDPVRAWRDKSGNSRDWTMTSGLNSLVLKTNIINGQPVIRNASVSALFDTGPDMSGLSAGEVFLVVRVANDPAIGQFTTGLWKFGTSGAVTHYPWSDDFIIYDECWTTVRKVTGDPTLNLASAFRLYNVISVSGEWTSNIDGAQHYTTATNTPGFAAAPYLFASNNPSYYLVGDIAELFIFSAKLSAGDRAAMQEYVASRYGLSF